MRILAILGFIIIFALTAVTAQTPKTALKKTPKPAKTAEVTSGTEDEEFKKAEAIPISQERIEAFQAFINNFPESSQVPRAQGLIVAARAALADKKLEAGDANAGIELFKLALKEAPAPVPEELFAQVILGFPLSLYSRNQRAAAFDMVKLIEEKVGANASQILDLSKFFINIQYGTEAIRLAKKSTELAPESATGFLTLAIAYRLNFMLEDAANAYAKAVELDPESVTNRRSLAEMKRALGKADEAIAIYRQLLEKDSTDAAAQTGLTLSLLDAGKIKEAEAEMAKALETTPNNPALLTGAAYWYAARGDGEKAVEYSKKALEIDRASVWSHIAQARGLLAQNKPLEAEKILLAARLYGNFPTLDYELASARLAAGLYREAAEALKSNFTVNKDGAIETYLGNRILADAPDFTTLLSLERRVALFENKAADSEESANKLKALLQFQQKLEAADVSEEELALAAEEFARGGDNMRLHRQLFAASRLLQKKKALPKVLELTQAAISGVDGALNVAAPATAVLADEIYDSRQYAIRQNLVVVVPEIPRKTLSAIIRGQIEDITARALLQQNNVPEAIIRLKRALSVLPEKSAWSRASYWRLGEALQADGKEKEALEAFIKGYNTEVPDAGKRAFIENLYIKVNGNVDGLDELVGAKPETTVAVIETKPTPNDTDNVKTTEPTPSPEIKTETSPTPLTEETPAAVTEVKSEPTPTTVETTETQSETKTEPKPLPESVPAATPEKTLEEKPSPTPENVEIDQKPLTAPSPAPTTPETPSPETTPKTEENKPEENKPEEVKTEETKSEETKSEEAKPGETKKDEVIPDEVKTDEIKPEETKSEPSPTLTETPPTKLQPSPSPEVTPSPETTPAEEKTDENNPEKTEETKTEETTPEEKKPAETKLEENPSTENKPAQTKPEPAPEPQKVAVIITENLPQIPPVSRIKEQKTENKPAEKTSQTGTKPLFEPVIISVGKSETTKPETTKTETTEPKPSEEKPVEEKPTGEKTIEENSVETVKTPEVVITEKLKPENNPTEKQSETSSPEKQRSEKILSGELRPRIIITENTGAKTVKEEISGCKLVVSPDSLSLLNGGGSLGVMVGFEGDGDFKQITAVSNSPNDIEVKLEPEIGASSGRAFFIVKSTSAKTGVFTVTFEAPCGKKEILVKVR